MRSKRQWIVVTSVAGLLISLVSVAAGIPARNRMLQDTGETLAAVRASVDRLVPSTASSVKDPALVRAAESLSQEPYVSQTWLVDPEGRIVVHRGGPGKLGDPVESVAHENAALVDALPESHMPSITRTLLLTAAAMRSEGDHNDVFRHLVHVVNDSEGRPSAIVGIGYDVSPQVSQPYPWYRALVGLPLAGFCAYWLGIPLWVYLDAKSRGDSPLLWGALTLITNLAGLIAYLLSARSPSTRT